MKQQLRHILSRFSRKRSLGLVITDQTISLCQVVHTALGPVEHGRQTIESSADAMESLLRRLLEPVLNTKAWRNAQVAVGLPFLRFLFTQRPVSPVQKETTGESLLHESLQLTNILVDDLAVDMDRSGSTASIVAIRKRYLEPLLEALTQVGVRPHTVEPAPFGLLRAAAEAYPEPGRQRAVLRVFLADESGLAILASGIRPLAWRAFPLESSCAQQAILSCMQGMRPVLEHAGLAELPTVILIHGRPDLARLAEEPGWGADLRVHHYPKPGFDENEAAFGVAMGCHREDDCFNLARHLRPQGSFLSVFPWGQALVEITILAAASILITNQYLETSTIARMLQSKASQYAWIEEKAVGDLESEKGTLTKQIESLRSFLQTRACWTKYTREVAARLPRSMTVTSFTGKNSFSDTAGTKASPNSRSLTLAIETEVPSTGSDPKELDVLLRNFRESTLLKETLPVHKLSPVKWAPKLVSGKSRGTVAQFTLTCEPPAKSTSKKEK